MRNKEKSQPLLSTKSGMSNPSRSLEPRARGYGIGGAYERPYRQRRATSGERAQTYGPLPPSGYYGAGGGSTRFDRGQAGYDKELAWYGPQYGEITSGKHEDS